MGGGSSLWAGAVAARTRAGRAGSGGTVSGVLVVLERLAGDTRVRQGLQRLTGGCKQCSAFQ